MEARKCLALVIEHIKKHPDRSLGIIAFSEKQQAVIEDVISDYRFLFSGRQFSAPSDLAAYLQPFADTSKNTLSRMIQPLFQDDYNYALRFEAWIIMHGYQHELTLWKGRFQEGQSSSDDIEEFFYNEEQEQVIEARKQLESEFVNSLDGFEDKFIELLTIYQDRIDNPTAFNALMNDYFPTNKLQTYLLMALYRMDTLQITEYCNREFYSEIFPIGIKGDPVVEMNIEQAIKWLSDLRKTNPNDRYAVIVHRERESLKDVLIDKIPEEYFSWNKVNDKKISVLTVEHAKGLGFETVLVLCDGMEINEQYIAYTRALDHLCVVK